MNLRPSNFPLETSGFSAQTDVAKRSQRGVSLVEVMFSMAILSLVALGFLGSFVQSRRLTESSVLHAAATSLVYGILEQMKGMDYVTLMPSDTIDPDQSTEDSYPLAGGLAKSPPYVRVRLNQDQVTWLRVVYSPASATGTPDPHAPLGLPVPTATATSLGAIDNLIGPLPLSTVSGTTSQSLTMNVWIWIDEIPNAGRDANEVRRITMIYTYTVKDGRTTRIIRDREVFLRTRFDQ
ncbi:type IV pilus modification PilV family protein [Oleiharenicola lentus]|uniref:type IV pilus modification PilV family protein n=1 Tax=Oleiharenicola lentus TaxID=2508720 RepID=UPI003F672615